MTLGLQSCRRSMSAAVNGSSFRASQSVREGWDSGRHGTIRPRAVEARRTYERRPPEMFNLKSTLIPCVMLLIGAAFALAFSSPRVVASSAVAPEEGPIQRWQVVRMSNEWGVILDTATGQT